MVGRRERIRSKGGGHETLGVRRRAYAEPAGEPVDAAQGGLLAGHEAIKAKPPGTGNIHLSVGPGIRAARPAPIGQVTNS